MSQRGTSADSFVEVYDEPLHRVQFRNAWALIYTVQIPLGVRTWWHRHTEDTVYFAIRDGKVEETLPGQPAFVTQVQCGRAVSRPHREQPLVHQVANVGDQLMHMVAAEAHDRPPVAHSAPLQVPGHELAWESSRFRVYSIAAEDSAIEIACERYGLLIALTGGRADGVDAQAQAVTPGPAAAGDWIWIEPPLTCRLAPGFRGMFAEWR